MNENQLTVEYKFDNPLIQKIDSFFDDCVKVCHNKYYHTFDHICEYGIKLTNDTNIETVNFTISDKSMASYELNRKSTVARTDGFIFDEIYKLTIKLYSNLSHIKIHYYLKL